MPPAAAERNGRLTALVTGAAGFIGCNLVERLISDGWSVRGLDDERTGDWGRVKAEVDRVDGSLEVMSADELQVLCGDVDVLFHLAAEKHNTPGVTADRTIEVNVAATARLFSAAGSVGVPKIVFTSSLYAYGSMGPDVMYEQDLPHPSTVYGVSKLAGEHLLRATERSYGVRWSVARLFFIYGPRQLAAGGYPSVVVRNFERIARDEAPVVNGDGSQTLDYVFVEDCVEALLRLGLGDHHGLTVNVASGTSTSVNDLTAAMLAVTGSLLEPTAGPADWTAGSRRVGSPDLAAERLAWKTTTPLDEGLRRVWEAA
ncbi:MAG: NAD-dependent epimerase/dehydratase family protein [Gaiella sp.]|nr:NAD-dependent epimerase/dehydratase family protein [Gaiella sp.]